MEYLPSVLMWRRTSSARTLAVHKAYFRRSPFLHMYIRYLPKLRAQVRNLAC